MDKIAKIRQEIERLKGICTAQIKANPGQTFPFVMEMTGYDKLLSFLSTLGTENPVPADLEEAKEAYCEEHNDDCFDATGDKCPHIRNAFIAGAKWQAEQLLKSSPIPEHTVLFNKGVEEGRRLMMEDFPKWRRIKAGERLPCPAYVWTIAYDNYPDCFEGRLMPNIQGVKVGRDTWYLPVDVIHNLPKDD